MSHDLETFLAIIRESIKIQMLEPQAQRMVILGYLPVVLKKLKNEEILKAERIKLIF